MIFADTVGLIALWDSRDQWHVPASKAYQSILAAGAVMVTTTAILLECGNAAARKPYRPLVVKLRHLMIEQQTLITPLDADWEQAWAAYGSGQAHDTGIVDLVSFEVMRRLEITQAFTTDEHFKSAGFEPLF